jgi:hypothetical protein
MRPPLAEWLALREPADTAARSVELTRAVVDTLPRERPLRILDLATGTGSNVRYLAPRLPVDQQWLAVDRDPDLLTRLIEDTSSLRSSRPLRSVAIETRAMDLGPLDRPEIFSGQHLVTASAFLDLVSAQWLDALAAQCRAAGAAVLVALTYNGRSHCTPAEPEDDEVRGLMNRHQRNNDKGFGRAAGPDATGCAERSFVAAGYHVRREPSDWVLTPDARELQRLLIEGWAHAGRHIAPERSGMIDDWLRRRLAHLAANRSHITVGHEDLAAWLP